MTPTYNDIAERQGTVRRIVGLPRRWGLLATLVAIVVLWAAAVGGAKAAPLPEEQAIDAQIVQGIAQHAFPSKESRQFEDRIEALIPDAEENCVQLPDPPARFDDPVATKAQSSLWEALRLIQESAVGAWLVQVAAARNVVLCLDHGTTLEAHYRSHLGLLGLNARLEQAGRVVFLAHELAHVPQHPRYSNNRRFSPADMLLLQRIREAAAEATATRVLWQLREKGIDAPWQEKLTTAYSDIAKTFEITMADGQGSARELWAARSAFHRWFDAGWRLEIYDDLMFKTLARIARDQIGLIPTSRYLTDHYLRGVAHYAGEGFLIGGDGSALIESFRDGILPAGGQARLDAILAESGHRRHGHEDVPLAGETLSAVSPNPTAKNRSR